MYISIKRNDKTFTDKKLRKSYIRMMIWLIVYYEFFCKKVSRYMHKHDA